ncbi:flagellar filament capping protein FliD [Reinekea sp.]|uniref:flagellar filament capping protein FliD n=1 Tax=Reinekea sp. TaxID=1970455 RepID=UPI00257DEDD1|nr:flagellar filament capping protein FliD [Reinekea sp.]
MAGIQSLGVGSGLLTSELVDQLVASDRAVSDLRLDAKSERVEAKISAYAEVRTVMDALQTSISSLAKATTIQSSTATSSQDSVLTGATVSGAQPGSYRINVDAVAQSHSLASQQYSSVDDTLGTGTLTFKFGTTSYDDTTGNYLSFSQDADVTTGELTISSANNTLGGVRDAINNGNFGVSASVVFDGTGYRLLTTSESTGVATSMEITAVGDAGLQALAYNSAQNDADSNMVETQVGSDASIRINGLAVTSTSNSLDQIIKGVTLNLTETSASAVTLTVARDTTAIGDKLEDFVTKYNEYKGIYDQLTQYNAGDNLGGILLGDNVLRTVHTQLRSGVTDIISGVTGSSYSSLLDLGITTDQNKNFNLTFDRSVFEAAMTADAQSVTGLLATDTQTSDAQVKVVIVGADTQPGTYAVDITQVATQGSYTGLTSSALAFASDVQISDVNDQFAMTVDGTTQTVTLTQGAYSSGDDLGLMLQTSINQAFTGQNVSVTFDDTEDRFNIVSSKFGASSEVTMGTGDPLVANTLGFNSVGGGEYSGSAFSNLNEAGFGASSSPGTQALAATQGVNFANNPVSFVLELTNTSTTYDGNPVTINLDEDWSDVFYTDGTINKDRDRADVLTYIQSELNSAFPLNVGLVTAEFNSSDRLVLRTDSSSSAQTLEISGTAITGAGVDYLGIADGTSSSGVAISGASFDLAYSNRQGSVTAAASITIPDATYQTGDLLALAIQNQINADANIAAGAQGATTEKGSRSLAATVDFSTNESQFGFTLNGEDYLVNVDSADSSLTNLQAIQAGIDSTTGSGGTSLSGLVTASLDSNGLVLTTAATGSAEILDITSDGIGSSTAAGTPTDGIALSTGKDFSANPAAVSLLVDGIAIDMTINGDGTTGTNDSVSNLAMIQQALDTALTAADGGGAFSAGDVVARLDSSNQVYFETVSKNGLPTETTFGADASIQITSADTNAATYLGITAGVQIINGYDSFGLDKGTYTGFNADSTVTYVQDDSGKGSFVITFDNSTNITLSNVSLGATVQLGLSSTNQSGTALNSGQDVAGSINGLAAKGAGQYLTAAKGAAAATNGYILGGVATDFSSAAVIDSTNNTLKVVIDGTESGTITLSSGAYASGDVLAAELKTQINADTTLAAASRSVDVQYDETTDTFGIFSTSTGSSSTAKVSEITTGGVNIFGFTTSTTGVSGTNISGSIDVAAGLMLNISGTRIGDRGSVTYVQGAMSKLDDLFNSILLSKGLLTVKEAMLGEDQADLVVARTAVDERVTVYEARLRSQFLYNDKLISQLNNVSDFLTQQFDAMNNSNKN